MKQQNTAITANKQR